MSPFRPNQYIILLMQWVSDAATSPFLWGIVIGLLLAVVVAVIQVRLEVRQKRRVVAIFCQELVSSICELIQNLEDNRDRNRIIDHEFLEIISAEINVYGRNREHLILIHDISLRGDVRRFFTRVATLLAQVQWRLRQFNEAYNFAQRENNPGVKQELKDISENHRQEAHKACDRLRELLMQREGLVKRLGKIPSHPLARFIPWR